MQELETSSVLAKTSTPCRLLPVVSIPFMRKFPDHAKRWMILLQCWFPPDLDHDIYSRSSQPSFSHTIVCIEPGEFTFCWISEILSQRLLMGRWYPTKYPRAPWWFPLPKGLENDSKGLHFSCFTNIYCNILRANEKLKTKYWTEQNCCLTPMSPTQVFCL